MRRALFMTLAGVDAGRLKSLKQRGILPFQLPHDDTEKWRRIEYSWLRAVLLVVMENIARDGGLSLEKAARLARESEDILKNSILKENREAGEEDLWIGVAETADRSKSDLVVGTCPSIARSLVAVESAKPYARIFLSNLTDAMRLVHGRAMEEGVNLKQEYVEDWRLYMEDPHSLPR